MIDLNKGAFHYSKAINAKNILESYLFQLAMYIQTLKLCNLLP